MKKLTDEQIQKLINETGVVDTEPLFVMAYLELIRSQELTMIEKLVFINLKGYAGQKKECFPSHSLIAKDLLTTRPTVKKAIDGLEEKGALISINRTDDDGNGKRKTSNTYILAQFDHETGKFKSESLEKFKVVKELAKFPKTKRKTERKAKNKTEKSE